jgi:hypothetical protein
LRDERRDHSLPIDQFQQKNEKQGKEKDPFQGTILPEISESSEKEGKEASDPLVGLLKLLNLKRLGLHHPGRKFFLLDKDSITVGTV